MRRKIPGEYPVPLLMPATARLGELRANTGTSAHGSLFAGYVGGRPLRSQTNTAASVTVGWQNRQLSRLRLESMAAASQLHLIGFVHGETRPSRRNRRLCASLVICLGHSGRAASAAALTRRAPADT